LWSSFRYLLSLYSVSAIPGRRMRLCPTALPWAPTVGILADANKIRPRLRTGSPRSHPQPPPGLFLRPVSNACKLLDRVSRTKVVLQKRKPMKHSPTQCGTLIESQQPQKRSRLPSYACRYSKANPSTLHQHILLDHVCRVPRVYPNSMINLSMQVRHTRHQCSYHASRAQDI